MNKKTPIILVSLLTLVTLWSPQTASGLTFPLPTKGNSMVGEIQHAQVEPRDSFNEIGRRFDVGYYELVEANPGVDPVHPPAGTEIVIPSIFILPQSPQTGIVVNLAEMRLYYYPPNKSVVMTYPIGVGRQGWLAPVCLTSVTNKSKFPYWYVPESIRVDRLKDGVELPKVVPPGPENPLGDYAMRLGITEGTFLIHGTNDPTGVGRRSSSGCIRMFPEDIQELFAQVAVGTKVAIISEPNKVGWNNHELYLESDVPLQEQEVEGESFTPLMATISRVLTRYAQADVSIDWEAAKVISQQRNGIPQAIGEVSADAVVTAETNQLLDDLVSGVGKIANLEDVEKNKPKVAGLTKQKHKAKIKLNA